MYKKGRREHDVQVVVEAEARASAPKTEKNTFYALTHAAAKNASFGQQK